jgi:hypothetical protein
MMFQAMSATSGLPVYPLEPINASFVIEVPAPLPQPGGVKQVPVLPLMSQTVLADVSRW